jgi:FlaA1/EpsC-like NDP-sugar epimerase
MQPTAVRRIDTLLALPRNAKIALAVMSDSALCVLTVWLAICFRFESWVNLSGYQWLAVALSITLAIPLLTAFGFYHTVIRFVGRQTITAALRAMAVYTLIFSAIFTAYGFPLVPRTIGLLQPLLLIIGLAFIRLFAAQLFIETKQKNTDTRTLTPLLIYGAGISGQQLAASLKSSGQSQVLGFLDDNASFQHARIAGIPVYSPSELGQLITAHQVRDVVLAMPGLSRSRRNEIIKSLATHRVAVRTLPSLTDLAHGKISETDLRDIDIEDLLGRDPVAPIPELMTKNITGKNVMVTGAGGSIGSELCRQIIRNKPAQLILLELSEYALYALHEELITYCQQQSITPVITPLLANVLDAVQVRQLLQRHKPHTIYHAAAYKHVPLVESNPIAGVRNNVIGTLNIGRLALEAGVEDVVLISTDKAVRPTNIMGASKRVAEMALQQLALQHAQTEQSTRFCIVRFGNVLGSSGSVVPKFREQIRQGGPITLTHSEMTRYFMTIPEAAQLVIQAGALHDTHQEGAPVYLLDMGEPVRILDMAHTMIQLSGLTPRDSNHPQGDIAVQITGLRPGEKLYEELLVDNSAHPTRHPKIRVADESSASAQQIEKVLIDIEALALAKTTHASMDITAQTRALLKTLIPLQDPITQ